VTVTSPSPAPAAEWPPQNPSHPFGDDDCWADPLTRAERRDLALLLASWCQRFYDAGTTAPDGRRAVHALICTSVEMSDLHLDVTERAQAAAA
jgi:hypothetical protein